MPQKNSGLSAKWQPMSAQALDREKGEGELLHEAAELASLYSGPYVKYGKRALDILSAALGLVLLSPVFALVACFIKLTSHGAVLFRQMRVGKDHRPFQILKFRSMLQEAPNRDLKITVAGDPRVTAIGKILRRYKIDELPQLWNVIRGEMSLVGPRPELPQYVAEYTLEQRTVLCTRPGITDPASLAYRLEEEMLADQSDPEQYYRTQILPDKLARNMGYLQKITFRNDIRIIVKTISSSFFFR
jgi:lipopolysaccharide/colanic/teichoic acid biosynthesis glycosyltransferase